MACYYDEDALEQCDNDIFEEVYPSSLKPVVEVGGIYRCEKCTNETVYRTGDIFTECPCHKDEALWRLIVAPFNGDDPLDL